jgi:hypothetical protein
MTQSLIKRCFAIWLFASSTAWSFDPAKVADGLYYNGTNVGMQLWTPLFLARNGELIDPFVFAQKNGVKALEGKGQTSMLEAKTVFMYGGCLVDVKLEETPPLLALVPTISVSEYHGMSCKRKQITAMSNYKENLYRKGSNPFPTYFMNQDSTRTGFLWLYGVPGKLLGRPLPVMPMPEQEIGARPAPVNGVLSRVTFAPLPVVEPDDIGIALADKKPLPKFTVGLGEAAHRSTDVVVTTELLRTTTAMLKERLWQRYYPRLEKALTDKLGGIKESYFELGLIQGIDLDNQTSFDYAGVARIGAITKKGQWRWVDVIYVWRKKDDSLSVVATSEDALYSEANKFFAQKNPSLWSPSLVISGFSDFDKDKQMEIIASLIRPVGTAHSTAGAPISTPIAFRQNFLYVWDKVKSSNGESLAWQSVYQTVEHEERTLWEDPNKLRIERFGE